jgi:hypothetical protein
MKRKAKDFELLDHGIDHAQYFQGCGVSFTKFTECYTGSGSNCAEAVNDCLEQIAMSGVYDVEDLEARIKEEYTADADWPLQPNTDEAHSDDEESELYYYVSIRLK